MYTSEMEDGRPRPSKYWVYQELTFRCQEIEESCSKYGVPGCGEAFATSVNARTYV